MGPSEYLAALVPTARTTQAVGHEGEPPALWPDTQGNTGQTGGSPQHSHTKSGRAGGQSCKRGGGGLL